MRGIKHKIYYEQEKICYDILQIIISSKDISFLDLNILNIQFYGKQFPRDTLV